MSIRIENLLNEAIKYHQKNDFNNAEKLYLLVIQEDANNSDALHLIGVINYQKNDLNKAEKLISKAIELNPRVEEYYSNLESSI